MHDVTDKQMREAFKTVSQTGDIEAEELVVMKKSQYLALKEGAKAMTTKTEIQKRCRDNAASWLWSFRWALMMTRRSNDMFYSKIASRYARNYAYWKAKAKRHDEKTVNHPQTDSSRLEWMVKNQKAIQHEDGSYAIEARYIPEMVWFDDWRDAIDEAICKEQGNNND